jgi:hypothetical protein
MLTLTSAWVLSIFTATEQSRTPKKRSDGLPKQLMKGMSAQRKCLKKYQVMIGIPNI